MRGLDRRLSRQPEDAAAGKRLWLCAVISIGFVGGCAIIVSRPTLATLAVAAPLGILAGLTVGALIRWWAR
jgi:hypothetical protein